MMETKVGFVIYALTLRGLAWLPSRNPLRNLRWTIFKCLNLPVPVVFLLFAFTDQLSKKIFLISHTVYSTKFKQLTRTSLSSWVPTLRAEGLLNMIGRASATATQGVCLIAALSER